MLDDEGLQILLCEVESIINDRPITTTSDDPNDLEVLTPNHLLLMRTQPNIPPGVFKRGPICAPPLETNPIHGGPVLAQMDTSIYLSYKNDRSGAHQGGTSSLEMLFLS